jgi:hypothetical protein
MPVADERRAHEDAVERAQNRLVFWFAVGIWLVIARWTWEALRDPVPPATLPQAGSRALGRADHPAE